MKQCDQKLYSKVRGIINSLRSEVLCACELVLAGDGDREKFTKLRKQILRLFGEAWGAEKRLKDAFCNDQPQNGRAGSSECCGKCRCSMKRA